MANVIAQAGAFATDGDILRLTVYTWLNNQLGMISIGERVTGSAGVGVTYGDIALAVLNGIDSSIQLLMGLGADLLGVKVAPAMKGSTDLPGVATSTASGTGSIAQAGQVSGMLSTQTAKAGRGYRGRMYIPWPKTSSVDTDGTPTATYVTDLQALGAAFGIGTGGTDVAGALGGSASVIPTLYHRKTNTHDDLTGFVARKAWATQRRRGDYGRQNSNLIPY